MTKVFSKEELYNKHDGLSSWYTVEVYFPYINSDGKSRKTFSTKNMYSRECRVSTCMDCGNIYAIINNNKRIYVKYVSYKGEGWYRSYHSVAKDVVTK